ncbi:hypothetical protein AB1Y20_006600 [Prymnesium parvum]|uniref:Tyrosine-protein kinase ephrin type A/B receptor-like domain-containing protein n=1 Tax=Prymnesium parvum TaxID=97485 RepID=A0AB34J0P7_PRYPA
MTVRRDLHSLGSLLVLSLLQGRVDGLPGISFGQLLRNTSSPVFSVGAEEHVTIEEGKWWHAQLRIADLIGKAPLRVEIQVLRASFCSEGANPDSSCVFGLQIFGVLGNQLGTRWQQHGVQVPSEPRHGDGEVYKLHVDACALRPELDRLFLGIWGWDGTSDLVIRASQLRPSQVEEFCQNPAQGIDSDHLPAPREHHAAVLVPTTPRTASTSSFDLLTRPSGTISSLRQLQSGRMLIFGGSLGPLADGKIDETITPGTGLQRLSGVSTAQAVAEAEEDAVEADSWKPSRRLSDELWSLDTFTRKWTRVRPGALLGGALWPEARQGHTMTLALSSNVVLLYGGEGLRGHLLDDLWVFNMSADDKRSNSTCWRRLLQEPRQPSSAQAARPFALQPSPQPRMHHAAVLMPASPALPEEALLIFGGLGMLVGESDAGAHVSRIVLDGVWRMGLKGATNGLQYWEQLEHRDLLSGERPAERYGHSAVVMADRSVLLFGGMVPPPGSGTTHPDAKASQQGSQLWRFSVEGGEYEDYVGWQGLRLSRQYYGQWSRVKPSRDSLWPTARAFHSAINLADGMLVYGGIDAQSRRLSDMWLFRNDAWQLLQPNVEAMSLSFARAAHSAAWIPHSTSALVYGGEYGANDENIRGDLLLLTPDTCAPLPEAAFGASGRQPSAAAKAGAVRGQEARTACVPCPSGTYARQGRVGEVTRGLAACEICPAGWLSDTGGVSECSRCPAGFFSEVPGLTSWAGCQMCPSGTFAPISGMTRCLDCPGDNSHHVCRAGSYQPAPTVTPNVQDAWSADVGGLSDLKSQDYPDVNIQTWRTKKLVQSIQLVITGVGFSLFFFFLTALSVSALSHPKLAETVLRSSDIPPISGGPGKSKEGGFFTIAYGFLYVSLIVALSFQFMFANERMTSTLLQLSTNHFETTTATVHVRFQLKGLPSDLCVLPPNRSRHEAQAQATVCDAGASLISNGLAPRSRGGLKLSCGLLDEVDGPGCAIDAQCVECNAISTWSEMRIQLNGRFAMAHAIVWNATIAWSKEETIAGSSSLKGVISPVSPTSGLRNHAEGQAVVKAGEGGELGSHADVTQKVLRGPEASEITLSLLPTVFSNQITGAHAKGFRLEYVASKPGSEADARTFHEVSPQLALSVQLQPIPQQLTIVVEALQTLLEFILQVVSLGAGLSFLCRFLLWFYLKVFAARAQQLGLTVKTSIEELRAREMAKRQLRELKRRKKSLRKSSRCNLESDEDWRTDGSSNSSSSSHICMPTATAGRWPSERRRRHSSSMLELLEFLRSPFRQRRSRNSQDHFERLTDTEEAAGTPASYRSPLAKSSSQSGNVADPEYERGETSADDEPTESKEFAGHQNGSERRASPFRTPDAKRSSLTRLAPMSAGHKFAVHARGHHRRNATWDGRRSIKLRVLRDQVDDNTPSARHLRPGRPKRRDTSSPALLRRGVISPDAEGESVRPAAVSLGDLPNTFDLASQPRRLWPGDERESSTCGAAHMCGTRRRTMSDSSALLVEEAQSTRQNTEMIPLAQRGLRPPEATSSAHAQACSLNHSEPQTQEADNVSTTCAMDESLNECSNATSRQASELSNVGRACCSQDIDEGNAETPTSEIVLWHERDHDRDLESPCLLIASSIPQSITASPPSPVALSGDQASTSGECVAIQEKLGQHAKLDKRVSSTRTCNSQH